MNLVVVESPAKAKTIKKYLGPGFEVLATYGHVRDLRPKEGAVEPDAGFVMHYAVIERNEKHVTAMIRAMKKADALYLATDPDREGEAIAWHVAELLKERGVLEGKHLCRVVFHEITQRAIREAVGNARELEMDLVNAQQARRALDYLVGFNLSPLLWKKITPGLSAGRVQSPALRMICEREAEISEFKPQEYWTLEADLNKDETDFIGRLSVYANEKVKQFTITTAEQAEAVKTTLEKLSDRQLQVISIEKKQRKRNPSAPFTTSTLQQEASRKLGFGAQRTMRTAQQLYEGIDTGSGTTGLISYMRTDSVTLAAEALDEIRGFIASHFGAGDVPEQLRVFKNRTKNAQEAHEAIRPTSVVRTPESLKSHLKDDQFRLYKLIWQRTMACQMVHATINTVAAELICPGHTEHRFRATGSTVANPGFLKVYNDDTFESAPDQESRLPHMAENDKVDLRSIRSEQHFTEPPPRFSEATLVRTLEEYGIGRPSTYASIISTLQNRKYAEIENRRFRPTDVGKLVNGFLTDHFSRYVDYDFTAHLEDDLDAISRGEKAWVPLMEQFWTPFIAQVADKEVSVSRKDVSKAIELGQDPVSGRPVSVRMGRFGAFAQLGVAEDEEKPRFAGLRPGQRMDEITLEQAMELFKLPRDLGATPDGEPVSTSVGRFGPYVKYASKYVSLGKDDDPYTIKLDRALELIAAKKLRDAPIQAWMHEGVEIVIRNGRYGPFVTDGSINASVPKSEDPVALSCARALEILEAKRQSPGRHKASKKKAQAKKPKVAATKKTTKKKTVKKKTKKKAAKKAGATKTPVKKKTARKKVAKKAPVALTQA